MMNDLHYTIAVILLLGWLIGFFGFSLGDFIHILLVMAVISLLFRLIRGNAK